MSDQFRVPCVIMRGGTSRAIFLKSNDLPSDSELRDKVILEIFGSPDVRQIDGLAGADSLTSKLAIIGPPTHPDADVDYTFGQVAINDSYIDYSGNCGNISSSVGPFAIDESMVTAVEPVTKVCIYNTNTKKLLYSEVQVKNGKSKVTGDCKIDGVPGTSAPVLLDFSETAGAATGKMLPTGNVVDVIETSRGPVEVSIVDVANPMVFLRASSVNMKGTETPAEIDGNAELLSYLEEIRAKCCVMIGMAATTEEATKKSPAFPMIAFITEAADYIDFTTGNTIHKEDVDFVSRLMYMQVLHKAYAGTATICTGVAAKIPGTIVNQIIANINQITSIRIGHPAGVIPVIAEVEDGIVKKAAFIRTARRIMEGYAYVEKARIEK
ncbi:PrpF domain-containing protein [Petroclostridium sp. X23]|uniref:2-methylaconitate cis-trans isomerase PrpF family protein n=1 Tax=Petroclostridium sp. X23 TaxID=3045146 RepID=UPI0024AD41C3|nr:PrpF domain-containing protein [Petroclostridium sp. X23]WHH61131.1 PrpF domain-containing protein [Petroclostridium sp. X23]